MMERVGVGMKSFQGKCSGGPYNGQMMASSEGRTKKLYRGPKVYGSVKADEPVEPVEIGEYRHDGADEWHWHPVRRLEG